MKIATATTLYGVRTIEEQHRWLLSKKAVRQAMRALGIDERDVPQLVDASAAPAVAYVNQGRWVADCPQSFCGGALILAPGVPFLCPNCLNLAIGHRYRPVLWPSEREAIQAALVVRPHPARMNWWPGETVEQLLAESAAAAELEAAL